MSNFIVAVVSLSWSLALVFMVMWIRARRASAKAETVVYGLRAQDDSDETTRTNLTAMDNQYQAAIQKLAQLGEVKRDDWGRWIWAESGQYLGN